MGSSDPQYLKPHTKAEFIQQPTAWKGGRKEQLACIPDQNKLPVDVN